MFNQSKMTITPDFYRKKKDTDVGDERTGDYVFKTIQPTVVDVILDLSQLSDAKKADAIQKMVTANQSGEKLEVLGFNVTKNYKSGAVYSFVVSDVIYTPKPQKATQ